MPETVLSRRAALSAINEEEAAHARSDGVAVRVLAPMTRLSLRMAPALAAQVADVAGLALDLPINRRREDAGRTYRADGRGAGQQSGHHDPRPEVDQRAGS